MFTIFKRKKKSPGKRPSPRKPILHSTVREKTPANLIPKEYGLAYTDPCLTLGGHEFTNVSGEWCHDPYYKVVPKPRFENMEKEICSLKEENNFLKIKIEVLLCLLSEMQCETENEKIKLNELEFSIKKESSNVAK